MTNEEWRAEFMQMTQFMKRIRGWTFVWVKHTAIVPCQLMDMTLPSTNDNQGAAP